MNIHYYIKSLDLKMEERYRGDCPICNGKNTFTAIKTNENILYNCYKAGCSLRGNSRYQYTVNDALAKNKNRVTKIEPFMLPKYVVSNREQIALWSEKYDIDSASLLYDVKENRIVFPVVHDGRIVDATGRALNKKQNPKWKRYGNSGYAYTLGSGDTAIVVEDCISAAVVPTIDHAFTGFALMGTSLLPSHVTQLQDYHTVIVALDPDAVQKTFDFTRKLRSFLHSKTIRSMKLEDDIKYRRKKDITNLIGEINGTSTITHTYE